jgi:lipopolysaccharide exporter
MDSVEGSAVPQSRNRFVTTVLVMIGLSPVVAAVNGLRQLFGRRRNPGETDPAPRIGGSR